MEEVKNFISKKTQIKAIQYNGLNIVKIVDFVDNNITAYNPVKDRTVDIAEIKDESYRDVNVKYYIKTPKGEMILSINDYIIKDENDDFYVCDPITFDNMYEEIKGNNYIYILGTPYELLRVSVGFEGILETTAGVCDRNLKRIIIVNTNSVESYKDKSKEWKFKDESSTIRHEIVHAYLAECGLLASTSSSYGPWAENEEMVDWMGVMGDKMFKTFKEADKWLDEEFYKEKEQKNEGN